eukprot:GHVH01001819.1.p1 GENE.GHVH01001819.1~~GHVH01001819.1.p1  ORF type:complete len:182 (+),score=26.48 GHVH01001819.1:175-720(+)
MSEDILSPIRDSPLAQKNLHDHHRVLHNISDLKASQIMELMNDGSPTQFVKKDIKKTAIPSKCQKSVLTAKDFQTKHETFPAPPPFHSIRKEGLKKSIISLPRIELSRQESNRESRSTATLKSMLPNIPVAISEVKQLVPSVRLVLLTVFWMTTLSTLYIGLDYVVNQYRSYYLEEHRVIM